MVLGDLMSNHLQLLHMAKRFIWLNETKQRINEFEIGYMINPSLYVYKSFRYQLENFMNTTFDALTQHFIKTTLLNK